MADIKVRIIAEDKASDVLKQTGKAVDDAGKKAKEAGGAFEGMGKTMASIAGGLGLQMGLQAIVGGLKNAVVGSFELAAALETTTVGFTTMLGSGDAAAAMLSDLKAFADTTPFEFADLTEAASKMIAMGTAAEDVIPTLTTVGDTAAGLGLGKAGIDRITLALGQMGAKGKIGGDDLRQLAEAGVPAMKYLADGAGVTTAEMAKLVEKGLVPAKEGVQTLLANMKQDFGGLMAKQAETASGKLSTMKDAVSGLGTEIGKSLVPAAKDGADVITQMAIAATKYVIAARTEQETLLALDDALRKHLITEEQFLAVTEVAPRPIGELRYAWEQTTFVIKDATAAQELLKQATQKAADTASFFTPSLDDLKTAAQDAAKKNTELADAINAKAVADLAAKAATDAHKDSLKLFADMSNLVSGAVGDYEKDQKTNTKTIADTEAAIKKLTAQHGRNQAAIFAAGDQIQDNTLELEKHSIATARDALSLADLQTKFANTDGLNRFADAQRDVSDAQEVLNKKLLDGDIDTKKFEDATGKLNERLGNAKESLDKGQMSQVEYDLAMRSSAVSTIENTTKLKELTDEHGKGKTAVQLAAGEQGNFNKQLGDLNIKLQEAKDKDIALQTQIATRIKEGLVLRDIEAAAEDGLTEAEILRIKTTAEALGVADSEAIAGTLRVETAATGLADARKTYASAFASENEAGIASFGAFVNSISGDVTNRIQPDLKKAQDAAKLTAKEFREIASEYNGIQSKEVTLRITTIRQTIEQKVAGGMTVAAAVASVSGGVVAGAKAGGGPVMGSAGTYLVGEMGPELFNPAGNGTIIPNSALGGMGGGSLRIGTINLYGVQSASELFNQLSKEARARGLQFAVN